MFSDLPLHPIVVHMPMALVILLPLISIAAFIIYKKSENISGKKILVTVGVFHLLLTLSTFVALETGEKEEDKVESVVAERFIEHHEHKAEEFMSASSVALVAVFLTAFLLADKFFTPSLVVVLILQAALVFMGYQVGHSGGELVYVHNAAQVHSQIAQSKGLDQKRIPTNEYEHDEDDDDD